MAARGKEAVRNTLEKGLLITRVFNADRQKVWKTWTEPERIKRWWGPKPFTAPVIKSDFKVGGKYSFCMRGPDGKDYWSTGVYREIITGKRLVMTDNFADGAGNVVPPAYYHLSGTWGPEILLIVLFEDWQGGTKLTLTQTGLPEGLMAEQTKAGWHTSLDKFAEALGEK